MKSTWQALIGWFRSKNLDGIGLEKFYGNPAPLEIESPAVSTRRFKVSDLWTTYLPTSPSLPSLDGTATAHRSIADAADIDHSYRHRNPYWVQIQRKDNRVNPMTMSTTIASAITKAASKQTYYTIRFLVDRRRVDDAYRAYGYFRWVDDTIDAGSMTCLERSAFVERQKSLLEKCYRGEIPSDVGIEEQMLIDLIQRDHEKNSGLYSYLHNMMMVMDFDARRRGGLISQVELNEYTRWLATAVTDNLHHFIGHGEFAPHDETRYLAVSAAHITHMLRDTYDDVQSGYYNIPREILEANHIRPQDLHSDAYRAWVKSRVQLAREYFKAGRDYFSRVQNSRCRLACFAYIARFDWLLDTIEKEGYRLRPQYEERKSARTGLRMGWLALASTFHWRGAGTIHQPVITHISDEV
jgi:phytoene/squalene synthetase